MYVDSKTYSKQENITKQADSQTQRINSWFSAGRLGWVIQGWGIKKYKQL